MLNAQHVICAYIYIRILTVSIAYIHTRARARLEHTQILNAQHAIRILTGSARALSKMTIRAALSARSLSKH